MTPYQDQAVIAAAISLVCLGLYVLLASRHLIRVLLGLQIIAKGTMLVLAVGGQHAGRLDLAQALIVTVIVADTVVTTAGLAMAIRVWRRFGTFDLGRLQELKG